MSHTALKRTSGIFKAAFERMRPCSPHPIKPTLTVSDLPAPTAAPRAMYGAAAMKAPSLAPVLRKSRRERGEEGRSAMAVSLSFWARASPLQDVRDWISLRGSDEILPCAQNDEGGERR